MANLELVCQLRTLNDNGEVSLSAQVPFEFLSLETVDRIHNQNYPRRNMQILGAFFNKMNSFEALQNFSAVHHVNLLVDRGTGFLSAGVRSNEVGLF